MPQDALRAERHFGRQHLLAGVLMAVMVAAIFHGASDLHGEGELVCDAVQSRLAALPARRLPCSELSYSIGPVDRVAVKRAGLAIKPATLTQYRYDDHGELLGMRRHVGRDGQVATTLDCSTVGKILIPFTNHGLWGSLAVSQVLRDAGARPVEQVGSASDLGMQGLSGHVKIQRDPTGEVVTRVVCAARMGEDDTLSRSVRVMGSPKVRLSTYDYDDPGDLAVRHDTLVHHPYAVTHRTEFGYACWGR